MVLSNVEYLFWYFSTALDENKQQQSCDTQQSSWPTKSMTCHTKLWIVRLIRLINVHVLKEDLEYVLNEESLKRNDRLLQTNFMSRLIMQGRFLFRGPWIMLWAFQTHSFYAKSK